MAHDQTTPPKDAIIQRIWMPPLWEVGDGTIPSAGQCELDDVSYILATPESLASSPEVAALIAEAEARGMERAAHVVRLHGNVARTKLRETYDAGDTRGNSLWSCIVGHLDIADDAIRAEAAAIRAAKGETP